MVAGNKSFTKGLKVWTKGSFVLIVNSLSNTCYHLKLDAKTITIVCSGWRAASLWIVPARRTATWISVAVKTKSLVEITKICVHLPWKMLSFSCLIETYLKCRRPSPFCYDISPPTCLAWCWRWDSFWYVRGQC